MIIDFFSVKLPIKMPRLGNEINLLRLFFLFIAAEVLVFSLLGVEGGLPIFIDPEVERFIRARYKLILIIIITFIMYPYKLEVMSKGLKKVVISGALILFMFQIGAWMYRLDYSVINASKKLAEMIPEKGTVVVGTAGGQLSIETQIFPIQFYPGIIYGNKDESEIRKYNPRYLLVSEDLYVKEMLSGKRPYSEWIGSFLPHEIYRFRISDVIKRPPNRKGEGDLVLFMLPDSVYLNSSEN